MKTKDGVHNIRQAGKLVFGTGIAPAEAKRIVIDYQQTVDDKKRIIADAQPVLRKYIELGKITKPEDRTELTSQQRAEAAKQIMQARLLRKQGFTWMDICTVIPVNIRTLMNRYKKTEHLATVSADDLSFIRP